MSRVGLSMLTVGEPEHHLLFLHVFFPQALFGSSFMCNISFSEKITHFVTSIETYPQDSVLKRTALKYLHFRNMLFPCFSSHMMVDKNSQLETTPLHSVSVIFTRIFSYYLNCVLDSGWQSHTPLSTPITGTLDVKKYALFCHLFPPLHLQRIKISLWEKSPQPNWRRYLSTPVKGNCVCLWDCSRWHFASFKARFFVLDPLEANKESLKDWEMPPPTWMLSSHCSNTAVQNHKIRGMPPLSQLKKQNMILLLYFHL